jgi:hypothetical protein
MKLFGAFTMKSCKKFSCYLCHVCLHLTTCSLIVVWVQVFALYRVLLQTLQFLTGSVKIVYIPSGYLRLGEVGCSIFFHCKNNCLYCILYEVFKNAISLK